MTPFLKSHAPIDIIIIIQHLLAQQPSSLVTHSQQIRLPDLQVQNHLTEEAVGPCEPGFGRGMVLVLCVCV